MTYLEVEQEIRKVRWKTQPCTQEECWCSLIVPEEPIKYNGGNSDEDILDYIIASGAVGKELAEHIVNIHNKSLES